MNKSSSSRVGWPVLLVVALAIAVTALALIGLMFAGIGLFSGLAGAPSLSIGEALVLSIAAVWWLPTAAVVGLLLSWGSSHVIRRGGGQVQSLWLSGVALGVVSSVLLVGFVFLRGF